MGRVPQLVAITGGAGRVGRLVAEDLASDGVEVRILDLPGIDYEGLDGRPGFKVHAGDIGDYDYLRTAFAGCDVVVHLAAVLPPVADENLELTQTVNVDGTSNVLHVMQETCPSAGLVFGSSVVVYGNTQGLEPPVGIEATLAGIGAYAQSKMICEQLIDESSISSTILRISGVSVADFLLPPDIWPFTREQRMEFVLREDVAAAAAAAVRRSDTRGRIFNVAGGETWQMTGQEYSDAYFEVFGMASEEAGFIGESTAFDFFETASTVSSLSFSPTIFPAYIKRVEGAIQKVLED